MNAAETIWTPSLGGDRLLAEEALWPPSGDWWTPYARVEMPKDVFASAIDYARSFKSSMIGCGALERHPAVLNLTAWWNAEGFETHPAALAHVFVYAGGIKRMRVGGYWNEMGELPLNVSWRPFSAYVAPNVIVAFLRSQSETYVKKQIHESFLDLEYVDGSSAGGTGGVMADYERGVIDEAHLTMRALRSLVSVASGAT